MPLGKPAFYRKIPAGNLFMSSAILFAGVTPHKALRAFKCVGIACISIHTFFRHQTKYLEAAVTSVWKEKQENLLAILKERGNALVVVVMEGVV